MHSAYKCLVFKENAPLSASWEVEDVQPVLWRGFISEFAISPIRKFLAYDMGPSATNAILLDGSSISSHFARESPLPPPFKVNEDELGRIGPLCHKM